MAHDPTLASRAKQPTFYTTAQGDYCRIHVPGRSGHALDRSQGSRRKNSLFETPDSDLRDALVILFQLWLYLFLGVFLKPALLLILLWQRSRRLRVEATPALRCLRVRPPKADATPQEKDNDA